MSIASPPQSGTFPLRLIGTRTKAIDYFPAGLKIIQEADGNDNILTPSCIRFTKPLSTCIDVEKEDPLAHIRRYIACRVSFTMISRSVLHWSSLAVLLLSVSYTMEPISRATSRETSLTSELQVAPGNASPNSGKLSKRAAVDESQLPPGWSYKGCYVYVRS